MYKWSDEQEMVRSVIRDFVDKEIRPHREALEFGDMPPYDVLRKFFSHLRHGRDGAGRLRPSASSARRRRSRGEARPERDRRTATATEAGGPRRRRVHDDRHHRALPGVPRPGDRDGRVDGPHRGRGQRQGHDRPEGAVGARPAHAGQDRRVGDHRAQLRLRRLRFDEVDRPARRRRVRPQRVQDVHHQRSVRRHDRVHLQARRGQPARGAHGPPVRARLGHGRASSSPSRSARWASTRARPASCSSTDVRVGRDRLLGESEEAFKGGAAARRRRRRSRSNAPASPPWRWASSSGASSCRSPTPRTGCSSASPSGSSS